MQIESVRVQNFRCIRDSGDIQLTRNLTILIGENESGKTALLDALVCFNLGQEFPTSDLSTMSPTREAVLSGMINKDTIDMVTVTIKLSSQEREQLRIPAGVLSGDILRITKRLDNSYIVKGANGSPLSEIYTSIKNNRLLSEIRGIRRQLGSVFHGSIVRKLPNDQFVFLRRSESDLESTALILFPSEAGDIWDELNQGDVVQVTHQAPDPYGRNARAMNVGKFVDFESELNTVETAISLEGHEFATSISLLLHRIEEMTYNHPLRSIFGDDFQDLLKEQIATNTGALPWNDDYILAQVPIFERGVVSAIEDKVPLAPSAADLPSIDEENGGIQALVNQVGLVPAEAVKAEHTERVRIFDEKSRLLSELFTESWGRDVQAEFVPFNQDKELGLAISCQGSLDPPSRRSQGFNAYLGLTASLLELGRRPKGGLILLLDDPAIHLHPTAQEKLADLLGSQSFQVLVSTHFPFMIRPDCLDQVRLLCRTETGAYLEDDWHQAEDGLLPVRGALSKWTLGRVPVLVEGNSDREILTQMSDLLRKCGKDSMSPFMEPLPSGGSSMPHAAKALRALGVNFIALVDGDQQGDDIKRRLMEEVEQSEGTVVSLRDVVDGRTAPKIEDVFSQHIRDSKPWTDENVVGTLKALRNGRLSLDQESEDNLSLLFQMLNEALEKEIDRS